MLKKLILIGVVVAFIPLEREKQVELYTAARATIADLSGFCDRNPDVCVKGNDAISKFGIKAEAGAKMVMDIVQERAEQQSGGAQDDRIAGLLHAPATPPVNTAASSGPKPAVPPRPATGDARFPAYQGKQYNEHYATQNPAQGHVLPADPAMLDTLRPEDRQPQWIGVQ